MASKAGQAPGSVKNLPPSMKSVPAPRDQASLVPPVPDAAKYLCEFVGTYILVLTVGMNVLGGTTVWAVASIAFSLMVMIYALGPVSGGHFNPAVSFTSCLMDRVDEKGRKVKLAILAASLCPDANVQMLMSRTVRPMSQTLRPMSRTLRPMSRH